MSNYITSFQTLADYEAAKENLNYPNVSLIDADGSLIYEKSAPTPPPTGCTFTISTDGESLIGQTIPTSFKFLKTAVDANNNGYVEWNTSDGHFGIDFEYASVGYDGSWVEYVDGGDGYYHTGDWSELEPYVPPANLTIESVLDVHDLVTPYDIECFS